MTPPGHHTLFKLQTVLNCSPSWDLTTPCKWPPGQARSGFAIKWGGPRSGSAAGGVSLRASGPEVPHCSSKPLSQMSRPSSGEAEEATPACRMGALPRQAEAEVSAPTLESGRVGSSPRIWGKSASLSICSPTARGDDK